MQIEPMLFARLFRTPVRRHHQPQSSVVEDSERTSVLQGLHSSGFLILGCLLFLSGAAACGPKPPTTISSYQCPVRQSESMAVSHMKEAYLQLKDMTKESAQEARQLASDGLTCAPPNGKATPATIAHLLLIRARAAAELSEPEAALLDLQAATQWASVKGGVEEPLLKPEIYLEQATIEMRTFENKKAANSAALARQSSQRLGKRAASLQCEALILEGDLATRADSTKPTSHGYYRNVFQIAHQFEYPEGVWPQMTRALARLDPSTESEARALMGPVFELQAAKLADEQKARSSTEVGARRPPELPTVSSGSLADADKAVAALRGGFRSCYQRALNLDPYAGGRAVLTLSVGSTGRVEQVQVDSQDMGSSLVNCLSNHARGAQFSPPATKHAVLSIPVTFVTQ